MLIILIYSALNNSQDHSYVDSQLFDLSTFERSTLPSDGKGLAIECVAQYDGIVYSIWKDDSNIGGDDTMSLPEFKFLDGEFIAFWRSCIFIWYFYKSCFKGIFKTRYI